ncbi:hypothetical protein ACFQ4O_05765 [Methylopila musalis]|uniref:Uncharacterized protein n=1 Tax=Methylopila musalis TaxID=1134781 RepID=A0ABW3Z6C0_9HYPH
MMRHLTSCLAVAALVAASGGLARPALAADDMGSNPITELFDAFGMGDKEKPDIEYKERPALVPPSSTSQLPPPQPKGAVGQATGQWPADPDVERRARQRELANLPRTEQNSYRMGDRDSRLLPSELGGRRLAPGEGGVAGYTPPTQGDNTISRLSPSELRAQKAQAAPAPAVEGQRKRLTDPPAGYQTPAASADYPGAQATAEARPWYKKINPFSSN